MLYHVQHVLYWALTARFMYVRLGRHVCAMLQYCGQANYREAPFQYSGSVPATLEAN
jgi:hypothetical protein